MRYRAPLISTVRSKSVTQMDFTVATYNVLATAYVKPEWYPLSPRELLDPLHRIPALVEHLAQLRADIFCLQEVEEVTYTAIAQRLSALGYGGTLARKGDDKPDGCATFFRTQAFEPVRVARVEYQDASAGQSPSGHIAQLLVLKAGQRFLGVANTHLKWDPPNVPREQQYGYRQMRQLLKERSLQAPECSSWVLCGDLNVTEDSDVVALLRESGFAFSHAGCSRAATCNSNRRAKMIDFVFHDRALRAEPAALPVVDDHTPLPGPAQPSDHVAVLARLAWRELEQEEA
jgi:mRNA deadenylase 3'-5' endonuclease subunit Ccr4